MTHKKTSKWGVGTRQTPRVVKVENAMQERLGSLAREIDEAGAEAPIDTADTGIVAVAEIRVIAPAHTRAHIAIASAAVVAAVVAVTEIGAEARIVETVIATIVVAAAAAAAAAAQRGAGAAAQRGAGVEAERRKAVVIVVALAIGAVVAERSAERQSLFSSKRVRVREEGPESGGIQSGAGYESGQGNNAERREISLAIWREWFVVPKSFGPTWMVLQIIIKPADMRICIYFLETNVHINLIT